MTVIFGSINKNKSTYKNDTLLYVVFNNTQSVTLSSVTQNLNGVGIKTGLLSVLLQFIFTKNSSHLACALCLQYCYSFYSIELDSSYSIVIFPYTLRMNEESM